MDVVQAFALALKERRKHVGMSQEDLALECGLDRTFISLLERGLRQPTLKSIFAIASSLSISASELISRVEANKMMK